MSHGINAVQLGVFIALFALVTAVGFLASRWRRAENLANLDEWALGGRNFGTLISWFMIGGNLYTAYTFVAVPALLFGAGAAGFFALPYTLVTYPLVFVAAVRMWTISQRHGYVAPADFVRGRYGSRQLALAVAVTGIVATMPYIALQLVGIEAVMKVMGLKGNWPIIVAFAVLAAFTYHSGLRAPALIAFIRDALIYLVVIVALVYIPIKLHGFSEIFAAADRKFSASEQTTDGTLLKSTQYLGFSTLALGSALGWFIYPHSVTGILAARSEDTVKRTLITLPAFTLLLGLLALLGYMAIAAGVTPISSGSMPDENTVVPLLFNKMFSSWFSGIAFAAIAIGALVPAAIMSIAAANLFTRNIYKEYLRPDATAADEARISKLMSLAVKGGALLVLLGVNPQFSIDLQLMGGVMIMQTLPPIIFGLYTAWFNRWAMLAGWAAGIISGVLMLYDTPNLLTGRDHFGGTQYALSKLGFDSKLSVYTGILALVLNLVVSVAGTLVARSRFLVKRKLVFE